MRAVRCTVRGLFAMQCARSGCIRALRAMRGGLVIGAGGALHGARIVCDAMRAGWLHSRGTGGAMLLAMGKTKGFIEPKGSRFKVDR